MKIEYTKERCMRRAETEPQDGHVAAGTGTLSEAVCAECGLTGAFCGHHYVGPCNVSLCMSCAEKPIEVFVLREEGGGSGYFNQTIEPALEELKALLESAEVGEGYTVTKETITGLQKHTMPEFDGF